MPARAASACWWPNAACPASRGRKLDKIGLHGTAGLFFDDVRVPAANLPGREGGGSLAGGEPIGRFPAGVGRVRGRRVADYRGHEAFLDGGAEVGLPGVDRPDRGFDLLGAGVLGQVTPSPGLQRAGMITS